MKLRSNGKSEQQAMVEQQQAREEDLANIQAAENGSDPSTNYVRTILDSELQDPTKDMLLNLLSRDWVLSQMNEAEVHEQRWLARVMADEIYAMHPAEDSIWTGAVRGYAADSDKQELDPLTSAEKTQIFQFIQGFVSRVLRSREGMQQETFRKNVRESRRPDDSDDSGGWM